MAATICGVGALVVLLGSSLPWSELSFAGAQGVPGGDAGAYSARQSGEGGVPALGLVALAGAGALLAVSGARRRAVAATVLVCGVAVVALCVRFQLDSSPDLADRAPMGWATVRSGPPRLETAYGALVTTVGGALLVVAGAMGLVARDRTQLGSRFEPPGRPAGGAADAVDDDGTDAWNAIDRGEDPTAGFTQP